MAHMLFAWLLLFLPTCFASVHCSFSFQEMYKTCKRAKHVQSAACKRNAEQLC